MGLPSANFYPESLTYFFEFGRSPDLRNRVGLPKVAIVEQTIFAVTISCFSDSKCNTNLI